MTGRSKIAMARASHDVRAIVGRWALLATGGLIVLLLTTVTSASAGPPVHTRNPSRDIFNFNHACGTAVDLSGDVYVASSGESKIRIFDAAHAELGSVSNSNEPCGLAVDTRGTLFAVERKTGNVVRYVPNSYPFAGAPSYGAAEAIDSEEARAIAVDTSLRLTNSSLPIGGDDSLFVAKGDHVDAYANETQRVDVQASDGTFTLSFDGQTTGSLPHNASHSEVQAALENLSTVGAGNVSVTTANFQATDHLVTFIHTLGLADVSPIEVDASGLVGSVVHGEVDGGLLAPIGGGNLTDVTGVAAYSNRVNNEQWDRYVFAADAAGDQVKVFSGPDLSALKLRRTIEGPKAGEDFGFGAAGAYLAADPGTGNTETRKCSAVGAQACTSGHFLVYDSLHGSVDEFEADGEFLDRLNSDEFADAEPTGLAVNRSGGADDGEIYVSTGAGPGAKLLAFNPLATPGRPRLPTLSRQLEGAKAVAIDSHGDVYVVSGSTVHVYSPQGNEIKVGPGGNGIAIDKPARDIAVDSAGKVYTAENLNNGNRELEKVQYYTPSSYPPASGTQYGGPVTVATGNSFLNSGSPVSSIGIDPADDHVFVTAGQTIELKSAAEGSEILNHCFACAFNSGQLTDVAVYGLNGNVYIAESSGRINIFDPGGTKILARIGGVGSFKGPFTASPGAIAVDQSNGHLLVFDNERGAAEEYDASGAIVTWFGAFSEIGLGAGVAIDNSGGVADGNVYVAFDDPLASAYDVSAFGPLTYGEAPLVQTGIASGLAEGHATLNGSVEPRGFPLKDCHFEYISETQYLEEGKDFAGAASVPCAESIAEIGNSLQPVSVHADINGLEAEERYRFRLLAENTFGQRLGEPPSLFGPPRLEPRTAQPVYYEEATLRAGIESSGLRTKYRFEYGTSEAYGSITPWAELPPADELVNVKAALSGLSAGEEYHFRLVAENDAKAVEGPDQTLVTLARRPEENCTNAEFRTGLSANLPDCRAYELVTPPDTGSAAEIGASPFGSAGQGFNNWLVAPRGPNAGESLAYFSGTLPGFEGGGQTDGYRSHRTMGEGPHPFKGWENEIVSPAFAQIGVDGTARQKSLASDQLFWFFHIGGASEGSEQSFSPGNYLRTPGGAGSSQCDPPPGQDHFELVGCGSFGVDPEAEPRYVSAGGAHVIFFSRKHLENGAASVGTMTIYDRAAGAASSDVVSLKPDGSAFGPGEDATYLASTEDGSAIVFSVGSVLFRHLGAQTTEIAAGPANAFAGISEDGGRVFYSDASSGDEPGDLFVCMVEAGPCAGPNAHPPIEIAKGSIFANVSSDGSHAFFVSEDVLTGNEQNERAEVAQAGMPNLYMWNGEHSPRFVGVLDPEDLVGFGTVGINLRRWSKSITAGVDIGRNQAPARSTPDGKVFVFQSHATLTPYDNAGFSEIYRYEPTAAPSQQLSCVSCDPSGAPPSAGATLVSAGAVGLVQLSTLIPNVTDDGKTVFFQSPDRLLPEDANASADVYEWKAQGTAACTRSAGCLALISSGQGEEPSYLYGMSADGHDVFFETPEKLVGQDIQSSVSIYDARVDGGIPDPPKEEGCQGDACQGSATASPNLPAPLTTGPSRGNGPGKHTCRKGKRRCAHTRKKHHRRRHGRQQAGKAKR